MRVGHRHIKHCTYVWEQAVTAFPDIPPHQRKQGKERAQSSRSLPQASQAPDQNSSLNHQTPPKLVLVIQIFSKAQGRRRRGKLRHSDLGSDNETRREVKF